MPRPDRIERPRQVHGARSRREYIGFALAYGDRFELFTELHEASATPPAYVNHGKWIVQCPCAEGTPQGPNHPAADPEWRLAICLDCGALYQPEFPHDIERIEAALLRRPDRLNRNFRPQDGETVADLLSENIAHGI